MMVSTEHIDNQKPEKRTWLKPLMRVTAIVLSLVGSFATRLGHFYHSTA